MKKSKVSVEDIKNYCERKANECLNVRVAEVDNGNTIRMLEYGGRAYKDVLSFIEGGEEYEW